MRSFRLASEATAGSRKASWRHLTAVVALGVVLVAVVPASTPSGASSGATSTWIVSDLDGSGPSLAQLAVKTVGGLLGQVLDSANAVEATLTSVQATALSLLPGIVLTPNISISLQSTVAPTTSSPSGVFATQTGATQLWARGDTGQGVNVAVLDTGIDALPDFGNRLVGGADLTGEGNPFQDDYGHGTFVAGLIGSSGASSDGKYTGEAPGAGLVSVKVADANGDTNLVTVLEGIDWTIAHAGALHIRVLNMSLGFVPFTSAYLNPLDLAVQTAWKAGIVVVVSAGNAGPFSGTILSPGDDPYVITVGAVDDNGSASAADDTMTNFSSAGPTNPDGFFKPDLVASGRSVVSLAAPGSTVYDANPSARIGSANFVGSGTSFSTAITSGAVALDLELHPNDTPNDVKARLLASASTGPAGNPFVDGHGVLDIAAAVEDNGVHLAQNYGAVASTGSMQGSLEVNPGDTLGAGYKFTMPGTHPAAMVQFAEPNVSFSLSCRNGGPLAGYATVVLTPGPYVDPATDNLALPTSSASSGASFQGTTKAPDLCDGAAMYAPSASLFMQVTSTDAVNPVEVAFHYTDEARPESAGWSATTSVIPTAPTSVGANVGLSQSWTQSGFDPSNWSGLSAPSTSSGAPPLANGLQWNGTAWNGTAWNGTAWNGTAWNGTAWNGTAWNGTAWNGTAWNGTAWNGTAWNGTAWNGSAWN